MWYTADKKKEKTQKHKPLLLNVNVRVILENKTTTIVEKNKHESYLVVIQKYGWIYIFMN